MGGINQPATYYYYCYYYYYYYYWHLCRWVPSGVPGKQARSSAFVSLAFSGAWGETLALGFAASGWYWPAVPLCARPGGLLKQSLVAPGSRN